MRYHTIFHTQLPTQGMMLRIPFGDFHNTHSTLHHLRIPYPTTEQVPRIVESKSMLPYASLPMPQTHNTVGIFCSVRELVSTVSEQQLHVLSLLSAVVLFFAPLPLAWIAGCLICRGFRFTFHEPAHIIQSVIDGDADAQSKLYEEKQLISRPRRPFIKEDIMQINLNVKNMVMHFN